MYLCAGFAFEPLHKSLFDSSSESVISIGFHARPLTLGQESESEDDRRRQLALVNRSFDVSNLGSTQVNTVVNVWFAHL